MLSTFTGNEVFSQCVMLLNTQDTFFTSVLKLKCIFPEQVLSPFLFLSVINVSKWKGVQKVFIPMHSQYSSHTSMLMEKLLRQRSLLTGKVTVSSRRGLGRRHGGWGLMDRGLHRRTWGGMLFLWYTVRTPETSDTAVAAVHLAHLPPASHFYWHKSFCQGNGLIIYSLSLTRPVSDRPLTVHLPVLFFLYQIILWGV